jgi:hypothetical protein
MNLDEWRCVEIYTEVMTCNDDVPVVAVSSYVVPGTDEIVSFTGSEEHESIALAKLDMQQRVLLMFGDCADD